jgi:hypothetical protein
MPGKPKITIATLPELGADKLAELLLTGAARNKQLKQDIELAISAKEGPERFGAGVRKRLASFAKSRPANCVEKFPANGFARTPNSLLHAKKFAVPLRREFRCKSLNFTAD